MSLKVSNVRVYLHFHWEKYGALDFTELFMRKKSKEKKHSMGDKYIQHSAIKKLRSLNYEEYPLIHSNPLYVFKIILRGSNDLNAWVL